MTKILLVEDNQDLANIIQRDLAEAHFDVYHAADGLRALELHAQYTPDLILLDWMLPKLDGIDVLRQIREHSATPVIMLTARNEELDRVMGLEAGADDYLTKPFSSLELIARVKAMLRRFEVIEQMLRQDKENPDTRVSWQGLELDPAAYRATLNGTVLDLSRTEFNVLRLFLHNIGRAFSRDYLLETVWEVDYIGGDRAVDNTILRLRKKLGEMGNQIKTVWGVGYRFGDE